MEREPSIGAAIPCPAAHQYRRRASTREDPNRIDSHRRCLREIEGPAVRRDHAKQPSLESAAVFAESTRIISGRFRTRSISARTADLTLSTSSGESGASPNSDAVIFQHGTRDRRANSHFENPTEVRSDFNSSANAGNMIHSTMLRLLC